MPHMIEIRNRTTGNVIWQAPQGTYHQASLRNANLKCARLINADLTDLDLSHADLTDADLTGADLTRTNLSRANLSRANLSYAILRDPSLIDAYLTNAIVFGTVFLGCRSLCHAIGLDKIAHQGPSSLDRYTLHKCIACLPDVFLTGVGYTPEEIGPLRTLFSTVKPSQFKSCFISYSHADEDFAQKLYDRLRQEGLRVWYAPEEMKGGEKLFDQIDHAIHLHDRLLLVLSGDSLKSEWVATEIRKAKDAERKGNDRKLFPIRLVPFDPHIKEWECFDADSGKDLGAEIREYFIPDFTRWKEHDYFETGVARLLLSMKVADPAA